MSATMVVRLAYYLLRNVAIAVEREFPVPSRDLVEMTAGLEDLLSWCNILDLDFMTLAEA